MNATPLLFSILLLLLGCETQDPKPVETSPVAPNPQNPPKDSDKENPPPPVTLNESGQAIFGPGIFTKDCVYGANKSISDHAPIIYGRNKAATWNITNPVSHIPFQGHLNHKFRINEERTLVDASNNPVFADFKSEYGGNVDDKRINHNYTIRLNNLASKIKALFLDHNLDYMAVQEIPGIKHFSDQFKVALEPGLTYLLPVLGGQPRMDAALIVKAGSSFKRNDLAQNFSRAQSYCDDDKNCVISAHLKFNNLESDDELKERCKELDTLVRNLRKNGFRHIMILGDFNQSAQRIEQVCTSWSHSLVIHTTPGEGASCSDASGEFGMTPKNIDVALEFSF